MSDVAVKGLAELQAFLDQLPARMEANVVRGALRAGAKVIQAEAQARARVHTGELRAGIKVSTSSKAGRVIAKVKLTGPHAFLGNWLEFTGAAPHLIKPRKVDGAVVVNGAPYSVVHHPGFHPKPFLRPALDTKASDAVVVAGNYIKDRLAAKNGLDTSDVEIEAQ